AAPAKVAVDGIPRDTTPTHAEGSYRAGIEEPGPDVGAWTSIATSDGKAKVAYQGRDAGTLKYAYERTPGAWTSYVVDHGDGAGPLGRPVRGGGRGSRRCARARVRRGPHGRLRDVVRRPGRGHGRRVHGGDRAAVRALARERHRLVGAALRATGRAARGGVLR